MVISRGKGSEGGRGLGMNEHVDDVGRGKGESPPSLTPPSPPLRCHHLRLRLRRCRLTLATTVADHLVSLAPL